MKNDYIPKQKMGAKADVVEQVNLDTKQEAQQQFTIAAKRLLDVSNWGAIAKGPSSEFCLADNLGNEIKRLAMEGDHIKINLPGPGTWIGGGDDWVKIESIIHNTDTLLDEEITVMTVRPCPNPLSSDTAVAHFFTDAATSTFMVKRHSSTLNAEVHGRNEEPNTDGKLFDGIRNRLVAWGDMAGLSNPQWKNLAKGLINPVKNLAPIPDGVLHFLLQDDGVFPNSKLPALVYKNVFQLPDNDSPEVIEEVFESNNWKNTWRNGIFDVHHYHSITHEVLGIYSGNCNVMLGGDKGEQVLLEKGDVLIIPAGVAHKNVGQSADFKCVGAYPDGKDYDMNYGKSEERPTTDEHIAAVAIPKTDPLYINEGWLFKYWK
jgi:uncharacterized protein YjlB